MPPQAKNIALRPYEHQHPDRDRAQFVDLGLLDGVRNDELIATNDMTRKGSELSYDLSFSLRTGNLPGGLSPSISWSGGLFRIDRDRAQFVDLGLLDGVRNDELIATNDMTRKARATNNNELAYIERKISN
jgi:hypothetical protein